ncbi:hypothetical protein BIW11_06909 [Tropilaelaps mercedesae]|uniref:Uncharacterized protein n=1 Tax=Tropilaelaps mercedesae TaxID=418985 RepID=A0A1V9XW22_9ACAR|nr:hypothetical protein BIW11_06909 [Tropilaelaps mercedesae]
MKPPEATVALIGLICAFTSHGALLQAGVQGRRQSSNCNMAETRPRRTVGNRATYRASRPNVAIMHFVLGGLRDLAGKSFNVDVLEAAPTKCGGIRKSLGREPPSNAHTLQDGSNGGAITDSLGPYNNNGFATVSGLTVGGGYRGGGYRGRKNLPVTPGGYRGISPPLTVPKMPTPPSGLTRPHSEDSNAKDIPLDQLLILPSSIQNLRPDRGSRLKRPWEPEIVVDLTQVIREDEALQPATLVKPFQPDTHVSLQFKPPHNPKSPSPTALQTSDGVDEFFVAKPPVTEDSGQNHLIGGSNGRPSRPPLVPVTSGGPPTNDFVSQLEQDLVAGLTPQQLEGISFQAIDPRRVRKQTSSENVLFPDRVI